MPDEDLDEVLDSVDVSRPKKFSGWFRQNFDCNEGSRGLVCEIEGEPMKITSTVRTADFSEDQRQDMVRAVKENHEINKEAGINFGDGSE